MRDLPPRVSEEQLQVTPYHPHNSVNLPKHLLHSTLHLLLGGDGLSHMYIQLYIVHQLRQMYPLLDPIQTPECH